MAVRTARRVRLLVRDLPSALRADVHASGDEGSAACTGRQRIDLSADNVERVRAYIQPARKRLALLPGPLQDFRF